MSPGLVLIGYRGTGKTTVGRIVAEATGRPFLDLDRAVEEAAGRPIAEVFALLGEPAFRTLEEEAIATRLGRGTSLVVASGGGAILKESNRRRLREHGTVVWLTARPEVLADRLGRDPGGRPSLTASGLLDEIADVLSLREPLYRQTAHEIVATDGLSPHEVARLVVERLGGSA